MRLHGSSRAIRGVLRKIFLALFASRVYSVCYAMPSSYMLYVANVARVACKYFFETLSHFSDINVKARLCWFLRLKGIIICFNASERRKQAATEYGVGKVRCDVAVVRTNVSNVCFNRCVQKISYVPCNYIQSVYMRINVNAFTQKDYGRGYRRIFFSFLILSYFIFSF